MSLVLKLQTLLGRDHLHVFCIVSSTSTTFISMPLGIIIIIFFSEYSWWNLLRCQVLHKSLAQHTLVFSNIISLHFFPSLIPNKNGNNINGFLCSASWWLTGPLMPLGFCSATDDNQCTGFFSHWPCECFAEALVALLYTAEGVLSIAFCSSCN